MIGQAHFENLGLVLVTGASGFLGAEVCRQLIADGVAVRAVVRAPAACGRELDCVVADILEPSTLAPAMRGIDCVIHAAGLAHVFAKTQAAPFKAVNEIGTANVAQAAANAGVRHLILTSSVSVYGGTASGVNETAVCRPEGPYAESKWQAEQRAIEIAQTTSTSLAILRLATLYGEGDPGNVARLMRSIDRGRFFWIGDGSNQKSLLYKSDAARACLAVLRSFDVGIHIYNVAASPCAMRQVVSGLAEALGCQLPSWHIPASWALESSALVARLGASRGRLNAWHSTIEKWLANDVYDGCKFERTFNFQPITKLTEGLARQVAWYRGQNARV